jgi:AsmA protein
MTLVSSASTPGINASLTLKNFDVVQSTTFFQPKQLLKGRLNLQASLSSSGATPDALLKHVSGTVKLTGADLDLVAADLDEVITRIINAQNSNLVDVAAFFFVGPLGASATKGLDVVNATRDLNRPGATPTRIVKLVSSWAVDNGIATARDVALETTRYRLALQGRVNLINREFDKVQIAVVNDKGCAVATQRLNGPIASPRTEKLNLLLNLAKPLLGIIGQSARLLTTGDCKPFYTGELLPAAPAPATAPAGEAKKEN